jgi:hypothetical protein
MGLAMYVFSGPWSETPDFHPEVGYLCPSARARRRLHRGLACLVAGVLITAAVAIVLTPPTPGSSEANDRVPAVVSIDLQPATPVESVSPPSQRLPGIITEASPPLAEISCNDLVGSFLNPACSAHKPRARHASGSAGHVATLTIGHVGGTPALEKPQNGSETASKRVDPPGKATEAFASTTHLPERRSRPNVKPEAVGAGSPLKIVPGWERKTRIVTTDATSDSAPRPFLGLGWFPFR